MPMHLCFDEKHRLWAFGWQRDAENNIMEDDEPYMVARRFTANRREAGSFLPRSLFSGKLSPFRGQRGLWRVEAAQGRIGGLAHPNTDRHQQEWVELDLDGNLIGRWAIDLDVHGGFAFTRSGWLFLKEGNTGRMFQLDKGQGRLVPVASPHRDPDNLNRSLLLGAVRDELVFAHEGGRLFHVDAGALPR
jgi:hypothetical protein